MAEQHQSTTPHGTSTAAPTEDANKGNNPQAVGGGKADGSPRATSHQGQVAAGPPPGGSNTPGGALNTGPDAGAQGTGSNQ